MINGIIKFCRPTTSKSERLSLSTVNNKDFLNGYLNKKKIRFCFIKLTQFT